MQITLSFEPHELPLAIAQLIRAFSGDVSGLAAGVTSFAATQSAEKSAPQSGGSQPPNSPRTPVAAQTALFPAASEPDQGSPVDAPSAEPSKRGRKPGSKNKPKLDETQTPVDPADVAPPALALNEPSAQPAATPADQKAAAGPEASPSTPSPSQAPAAAVNGPTLDDLRDAYAACDLRGVTADEIMPVIKHFGVTKLRDVPADRIAEAIDKLNALRPLTPAA